MAITEITIYNKTLKTGSLRFYPESASNTPSEAKYLLSRNALAANEEPIVVGYPTLGQNCIYSGGWYTYYVYRIPIYFDTSSIPAEMGIVSAKLRLYFSDISSLETDFDITIQDGQPTYPHDPAVLADYYHENYSGDGGSVNTSGAEGDGYLEVELTSLGKSWINKGVGAETKLMLRSSREISAIVPVYTSDERVGIYNTTGTYQMRLIIEYAPIGDTSGKVNITTEINIDDITIDMIKNTKAKRDSTQVAIKLYGEILNVRERTIIERGFEYLIQDEEPGAEDTGTEVKETGEGFGVGEYNLHEYEGNDVDFDDRLYRLPEDTIWWFRAYIKDDETNKFIAETWMKNVPTMTTFECTDIEAQKAKGNGEMIDKGANTVTRRGFRIIKEYEGDLMGLRYYDNVFGDFNLMGEIEMETLIGPGGTITGFIWRGIFYRDALWPISQTPGDFEVGIYENIIGGGISHEGFGIYLKPNDTYKIVAIAVNQHGMGFGEEVDLATGQNILPSTSYPEEEDGDRIVSETSAEKTIILGTIPEGETVIRIGIRLGRTEGCTDIHVYEDGEWGSGGSHTFYITGFVPGATYYKMPYIIIDHGDYEEEILAIPDYRNPERLDEWLEDYPLEIFPEVEDEDDLDQTVTDVSVGDISYRTIIKEIKCEKIGDQSFIDRYGRRRSQTISNHLIQSRANCITIADDYVERFQILKLKIEIDYDIPIPFERKDVILLGDGKHKLGEDGEGLIPCKDDGEGEVLQEDFILAKIRKIDSRFISGSETILSLELEV